MANEIEAKILNIDREKLEKKLIELGATKVADKFMRSITFDYPGFPLDKKASWVRLRDEGVGKIMLAFKQRLGVVDSQGGDSGMEEVEFSVESFETASMFLQKIGLIIKFFQEKKRTTYKKDDVTFDIDTCPMLPPYLEVEAPSWQEVDDAIENLGYSLQDKKVFTTTQIYELNGIRDKDYIRLTFEGLQKRDS